MYDYPLFPLLDFKLVGVASLEVDFLGVSDFSCPTGLATSDFPFALAAAFASPLLFLGSTWPMSGISDASHCWKGFTIKKPLTSNHLVKGDESWRVFVSPFELEYSTVILYIGVCFVTLEAIDSCYMNQRCYYVRTRLDTSYRLSPH